MAAKRSKNIWRVWAKAIGEKSSACPQESDRVAMVRTLILLTYLLTNCFIVAGVVRHWDKDGGGGQLKNCHTTLSVAPQSVIE